MLAHLISEKAVEDFAHFSIEDPLGEEVAVGGQRGGRPRLGDPLRLVIALLISALCIGVSVAGNVAVVVHLRLIQARG